MLSGMDRRTEILADQIAPAVLRPIDLFSEFGQPIMQRRFRNAAELSGKGGAKIFLALEPFASFDPADNVHQSGKDKEDRLGHATAQAPSLFG